MLPKEAFLGGLFLVVGCRTATQVTVELATDVACGEKPSTMAQVGRLGSDIETRPASVATTACAGGGRIGSFVVVPSASSSEAFAVKVVLAHGRTVESCEAVEATSGDFTGCIVARRALRFIPHTELILPIVLRQDCDGVICDVRKTCVRGSCADAVVPDPGSCASSGCPDDLLMRPDAGNVDAGAVDASEVPDAAPVPDGSDALAASSDVLVDTASEVPVNPCADASCLVPPSCAAQLLCGTQSDSCCASPLVSGGTFLVQNLMGFPRTISSFRLDCYEVTVGRFRAFVSAVVGGWVPAAGAGKHVHLADGGLRNMFDNLIETGWDPAWNTFLPKAKNVWDDVDHLACGGTWTQNAGPNEKRPIGCVNWYHAAAFCIWDGGFLPSFTERNYASAGGDQQRVYPWGSEAPDGNRAQYCMVTGGNMCNVRPPFLEVGSKPSGDGLFRQADLAGNVWEWILDNDVGQEICKDCFFLNAALESRLNPGAGVNSQPGTALMTSLAYEPDLMTYRAPEVGFRCARSP